MDLPPPTLGPPPQVPSADVSVRVARPPDALEIGEVQAAAWHASYGAVLPAEALDRLQPAELAQVWRDAITALPTAQHAVLVALDRGAVVGFAAVAPAEPVQEGVGEIAALVVGPQAQRAGHGSRLLNAAADRLRDSGFDQAVVWVLSADDVRRHFLTAAGFAADGAHRSLALGDGDDELDELRLVASLAPPG